jgi:hypothetical protein
MVNFYFSKGFIESFRAKFCEKLKAKRTYKIRANKTRFMEETLGGFAKKPFETQSLWWNIWVDTHKIAISNHRIRSIDTQNVTFDYKDYRVAGALKQMTLTHEEFIRRFPCIYYPNAL